MSRQGESGADGFGRSRRSLPAELLAPHLDSAGIRFALGPLSARQPNAVCCLGQELDLPADESSDLFLLAATASEDRDASFLLGDRRIDLRIQGYTGFVGQWRQRYRRWSGWTRPGFIKRDPIAWLGSHRHDRHGNDEPYVFCYLFRYRLALARGCRRLRLPNDPAIHILGLTLASGVQTMTVAAGDLYG